MSSDFGCTLSVGAICFEDRVYGSKRGGIEEVGGYIQDMPCTSLVPRPHPHKERGLVTIEQFLGYAESAVLILNNPMK